jgi:hypothetical protein
MAVHAQIDGTLVRDAIDFLYHQRDDKIKQSRELLTHLEHIEAAAENGGLSAANFSLLCRIVIRMQMMPRLKLRVLSTLVPAEPVPSETILFPDPRPLFA